MKHRTKQYTFDDLTPESLAWIADTWGGLRIGHPVSEVYAFMKLRKDRDMLNMALSAWNAVSNRDAHHKDVHEIVLAHRQYQEWVQLQVQASS